jgi:uncharacterized UBP type Zn finger protein
MFCVYPECFEITEQVCHNCGRPLCTQHVSWGICRENQPCETIAETRTTTAKLTHAEKSILIDMLQEDIAQWDVGEEPAITSTGYIERSVQLRALLKKVVTL